MVNLYKVFPIAYSFALTLMISLWIRTKVTVKDTPFSYFSSSFILPVSPNVATDEEMRLLEESQLSKAKLLSNTKMLKAIRRRNFLDICQETISYRLI